MSSDRDEATAPHDLIEALTEEHEYLVDALRELETLLLADGAGDGRIVDRPRVERLATIVTDDLDRHARREEDHLFGLLIRRGMHLGELSRWLRDHETIREVGEDLSVCLLEWLSSEDRMPNRVVAVAGQLRTLFTTHADNEEQVLFSAARRVIPPQDLVARLAPWESGKTRDDRSL